MQSCKNCRYQQVHACLGRICLHKPAKEGKGEKYVSCIDVGCCQYYIPYKDAETTYRIERITDMDGRDKTEGRYPLRIGRLCTKPLISIGFPARIVYLENADGSDYSGKMYLTTPVSTAKETDNELTVVTEESIYHFRKERPKE